MADRPKPIVRLIVIASRAVIDPTDNTWVVRNPLAVVTTAVGERLPVREPEIGVYVHLCDGLGRWELAVEFGQRLDNGIFRVTKTSPSEVVAFGPHARLAVWEWGATFRNVPLREGLYEFRVVGRSADSPDRTPFEVLDGPRPGVPAVAELRVLEGGGQL
jgi:hypothetical protein